MSQFIVNLPEKLSGAAIEHQIFATLKKLIAMEKKDIAILADPNKYLDKGDFMAVVEAFAELSGYINGTSPEWNILKGALNTKEAAALKGALKSVLSKYNDVQIPVGTNEEGQTIYTRVYADPAHKTPATAWDFVKDWLDTNGKNRVNFYFSYNDKHIRGGNKPAWTGGQSDDFSTGCSGSEHKYFNPTGEPGGGITVHEQDAGHHCHHPDYNTYDCSGDAQAIAGFCHYSNQNDPNYNGDADFDKYLDKAGLGFNL